MSSIFLERLVSKLKVCLRVILGGLKALANAWNHVSGLEALPLHLKNHFQEYKGSIEIVFGLILSRSF